MPSRGISLSHLYTISPLEDIDLKTDVDHFVEQLRRQWPDAEVHFISDSTANSYLQWKIETDNNTILGDLGGQNSVWFKSYNRSDVAKFALWYRTILPYQHRLFLYKDSLSHQPIELTSHTSEVDIIAGFDIPFDSDAFDRLLKNRN